MEHLRQLFEEALDVSIAEDGKSLVIAANTFTPAEVLSLAGDAYRIAYKSWIEEQWLLEIESKVEDIVALGNNRARLATLVQKIKESKVTPFIGSGMSASSELKTWTGFLWELQSNSNCPAEKLEALLKDKKFEEAAQEIFDSIKQNLFVERCQSLLTLNSYDQVKGPVRLLPALFRNTVLTTNFDNLIEILYRSNNIGFTDVIYGAESIPNDLPVVSPNSRFLFKLHGDAARSHTLVLTKAQYRRHYAKKAQYRQDIVEIVTHDSLLFLGCSLETDKLVQLMRESISVGSRVVHYCFLPHPCSAEERVFRENELAKSKIFPIWYGTAEQAQSEKDKTGKIDHDSSIEALLVYLIKQSNNIDRLLSDNK